MIHDECAELTSTIMACPKEKILTKNIIVESISELAVMLSSTKTRRILYDTNASNLEGILDTLQYVTNALSEKSKHTNERWLPLMQQL